jgi:hypothetical protein
MLKKLHNFVKENTQIFRIFWKIQFLTWNFQFYYLTDMCVCVEAAPLLFTGTKISIFIQNERALLIGPWHPCLWSLVSSLFHPQFEYSMLRQPCQSRVVKLRFGVFGHK